MIAARRTHGRRRCADTASSGSGVGRWRRTRTPTPTLRRTRRTPRRTPPAATGVGRSAGHLGVPPSPPGPCSLSPVLWCALASSRPGLRVRRRRSGLPWPGPCGHESDVVVGASVGSRRWSCGTPRPRRSSAPSSRMAGSRRSVPSLRSRHARRGPSAGGGTPTGSAGSSTPATRAWRGRASTAGGVRRRPSSSCSSRRRRGRGRRTWGSTSSARCTRARRSSRRHAEQKSAHLQKILCGDELWCQGFSEPGAASDLTPLRTRHARRRRLRAQRAEDLVLVRSDRRLRRVPRAHRPRRGEASRDLVADPAHGHAGHRGATAADGARLVGVLRGVPHRRARAREQPRRRGERRLAGHQRDAVVRTGHRVRE